MTKGTLISLAGRLWACVLLGGATTLLTACGARTDLGGHFVEPAIDAATDGPRADQMAPDSGVTSLTANVNIALDPLFLALDDTSVY